MSDNVTQVIEPIVFTQTPEPVGFIDFSGSTDDVVKKGSPKKRTQVIVEVYRLIVAKLYEADAAAQAAKAAGHAEAKGGGVLSYAISGHGANELEDVNPGNFDEVFSAWQPNGMTYLMPNIAAWEADREEEFGTDEAKDINRTFCLNLVMDGALNDRVQFEQWASHQPANVLVFIALIGDGDDTREADKEYMQLAANHANVKAVSFMGEDDPEIIARTMLQFFAL